MHLDETIRSIQAAIEQKFLFRKIGLPFDYASPPDDFPSKCFATAKEARANLPNPSGLGGGYHFSCRNHALLFDGYLLRVEAGIESPGDEAILDRLIGGLIRLATVAPKSFLVSGLAPDGRGFYGQPRRENHAAWAFAALRGLSTAAISPESQEKFRSIAGKWFERLRRDKFRLTCIDGKAAPGGGIALPDADEGVFLLAAMLTAAKASGEDRDAQAYAQAAGENERARFGGFAPEGGWTAAMMPELLWRQAAWSVVRDQDPDGDRKALARMRMEEYAAAAAEHAGAWRAWDRTLLEEKPDFDWRKAPKVSSEESVRGFDASGWRRVENDQAVGSALAAALTVFLTGDAALAESVAGEAEACLREIPWDGIVALSALAPAVGVHARGVELGLWDKELYDDRRETPSVEVSFAAKYLEPDYDEAHPEQAGHRHAPPGKRRRAEEEAKPEGGGQKKRRRRKRR